MGFHMGNAFCVLEQAELLRTSERGRGEDLTRSVPLRQTTYGGQGCACTRTPRLQRKRRFLANLQSGVSGKPSFPA